MNDKLTAAIANLDAVCKNKALHNSISYIDGIVDHLLRVGDAIDQVELESNNSNSIITANCTDYSECIFDLIDGLRSIRDRAKEINMYTMAEDITKKETEDATD